MANWVVVGTGALGTLWALGLQRAQHTVQIYARQAEGANITLSRTYDQTTESATFPVIQSASEAPADAVWLIIVKAWQLEPLLTDLQLPRRQPVIISHNGMGAADAMLSEFVSVYDLVTTHGAWRQSRTHSLHAGLGQSWFGLRHAKEQEDETLRTIPAPPWFSDLAAALPPLHWCDDIELKRWEKLAINCAINPLATLANGVNGVLRDEIYAPKLRAICEEIANLNPKLDADQLLTQVREVIRNTAGNYCSMLQDKHAKRPTEIDFLNGFVCREGERKNVATRTNCELAEQITALTCPQ
ncbi:ketopantoate reductase family protein [Aliidiomarina sanyensis]|uniref:2-dehydropantoate 2-reductase n=1 Tax=Aliidiomarina sanyensis TaxID=1249555 RepID=A0A432WNW0_9GAMM|nr:ketopantoate reductase family protein [Aliidiomarina sanyensis]RUO35377.1 hypothetical protein CWE11_05020 [Aliidiomarina sanyensis]